MSLHRSTARQSRPFLTPAAYANRSAPDTQWEGRYATPGALRPVPLLHRAKWAQLNLGLCPSLDEKKALRSLAISTSLLVCAFCGQMKTDAGEPQCEPSNTGWPSMKIFPGNPHHVSLERLTTVHACLDVFALRREGPAGWRISDAGNEAWG